MTFLTCGTDLQVIDVADGIAQLRSKLDKSVVDKDPKLIILPNEVKFQDQFFFQ